jgi:hypothetical protein
MGHSGVFSWAEEIFEFFGMQVDNRILSIAD